MEYCRRAIMLQFYEHSGSLLSASKFECSHTLSAAIQRWALRERILQY